MKTTKRALFSSVMALILCFSMLVGTTFAWFTDSVESGVNQIIAGNLDVDVLVDGASIQDQSVLFDGIKWEPGVVAYENLTVKNLGNLALKYQLSVNFDKATTNANGDTLAKVLKVGFVEGGIKSSTRDGALSEVKQWLPLASFAQNGELYPVDDDDTTIDNKTYGIVIYWQPSEFDNEFNMNNGQTNKMSIDLGVKLFATQLDAEMDSFDNTYDKDSAAFTVAEANAMLKENKNVTLVGCIEPNGVVEIPAGYTGTLTLCDVTLKSVQAADAANIVILGDVVVNAYGDGTAAVADGSGVSAITGTALNITGDGKLTAIAMGDFAYGIGGEQTEVITIKNIHIVDVRGGHVQPNFINDTSYGKSEPTGGAAIGSGYSGAVITLEGVTIDNAQGGSKAAGIGGRYWTGVTININNSIINNVEGGNASAGIGGSRVSDDIEPAKQHVIINIKGSKINATGGQFGAGIGSGYDTHCGQKKVGGQDVAHITETICTINIDAASDITAQGGKYAAGVGTGYHVAALAGNIECKVNATAGESREKYTVAQAVGFGVVDHKREVAALSTAPSIQYEGAEIEVPSAQITNQADFAQALTNGESNIVLGAGAFTMPSTSKDVTITGTKDTKVNLPFKAVYGSGNVITFEGITVVGETESSWYSELFNGATKVVYKNCEIYNQLTTYCDSEFIGCNFYNTFDNDYSVYCYSGKEIKFDGCSFDSKCSKAIKVYDEGNGGRKVYINDCTFTTETANKKAAVEIDSSKSTYYIYFTGNNVLNGAYTKLWNSDPGEDQGTNVYINGDDVVHTIAIGTLAELIAFADDVNVNGNSYSGKTIVLTADIDLNNMEWTPIGQTGGNGVATYFQGRFDGKGHTISNLKITDNAYDEGANYAAGFFGFIDAADASIVNLTINGAEVNGHHWTGVIAGYLSGNITDCTVKNAKVNCTHANGDACGDKAGVIVGYVNKGLVTRNTVEDCTVTAGRDAGQVVGCAKAEYVSGNTIRNVSVSAAGGCTGANIRNEEIGRLN